MKSLPKFTLGLAVMALFLSAAAPSAYAQANSANVVLSRTVSGNFEPNAILQLTVNLTKNPGTAILALAVRETLPAGWVFKSVDSATNGQTPSIAPSADDGGVLEFAWINTPTFPFSMTYSVQASNTADAAVNITGQAEYRTTGAAEFSAVTTTTIEPSKSGFCGCAPTGNAGSMKGDLAVVAGVALLLLGGTALRRRRAAEAVRTDDRR
ncbi:MAG: hypothetical protein GC168_00765 [Candidatus Hydrogenedens sp.]|nr:hypothetical protein [Candidatus Hydrogenedens sp.]